jgi:putative ABC transport system ATP-binding protein
MLRLVGVGRDFVEGQRRLTVLDGIDLEIARGEFAAITGPSGSGKSTLLGLMAGLDRPSRGRIEIDGHDITAMSEDELSRFRGQKIGFVFQSFQLLPTLTALENVRVPAELLGDAALARRAPALLEEIGLGARLHHYPAQLSGGEQQRVAIARASLIRPALLLADEPTGNLDSANGERIMQLLLALNQHCTLVLVTHNAELAALAHREVRLRDGRIAEIVLHGGSAGPAASREPGPAAQTAPARGRAEVG